MAFNQSHSSIVLFAGGNTCFYGNLTNSPGVCADGARLEGTITMWLPKKIRSVLYPWKRSFEGGVRSVHTVSPLSCARACVCVVCVRARACV